MTDAADLTFGRLSPGAAESCAELEMVLFEDDGPWSAEAFRSELANAANFYAGFVDSTDRVRGYGGVTRLGPADAPEYEIQTVGLDPSLQGHGLGRKLVEALLAAADESPGDVFLEVRVDNDPAIGLYESLGFEKVGLRKNYYRPSGADAWTMKRPAVRT